MAFELTIQSFVRILLWGSGYREDGCVEKGLTDDYGHGTAVYGIIRKALPYADILNIQIPGIENGIEEETLCRLLYYLADKVPADDQFEF